LTHWWCHW